MSYSKCVILVILLIGFSNAYGQSDSPITNNIITLREYVDVRFCALENKMQLMFESNQNALDLATEINKERLEKMNNLREEIGKATIQNVSRTEYLEKYKVLDDKIADLAKQSGLFMLRSQYDDKHSVLQNDINELKQYKASLEGKASVSSVYISYAFNGITLLVAIMSIILHTKKNNRSQ